MSDNYMFYDENSFESKMNKIALMKLPEQKETKEKIKEPKILSAEEIEARRKKQLEYNLAWRKANPEKYKQSLKKGQKKYKQKNRRKFAEIENRYYHNHREEILARAAEKRRKLKDAEGK